jgi:protein-S-isoprenylcysteine O-methyltransferase Ste14
MCATALKPSPAVRRTAGMNGDARSSPWWYRHRGTLIGTIYGLGFLLGAIPLGGKPQPAVFEVWGGDVALWLAVASVLCAWVWRASGTAYLRRDVVFAADVQSDRLIVAGVFRYVRNPLYIGNVFLALGIGLLATPLGFAVIVAGNALFVALLAAEEARELELRYGAAFRAYRAAVPAFVPRFTPAGLDGSVTVEPAWTHALLGEGFSLALAVAIVPIALFGQAGVPAFWTIWGAAFLLFAYNGWRAGRARATRR